MSASLFVLVSSLNVSLLCLCGSLRRWLSLSFPVCVCCASVSESHCMSVSLGESYCMSVSLGESHCMSVSLGESHCMSGEPG